MFAGWFADVLAEVEPELAGCIGIVWWRGGDEAPEAALRGVYWLPEGILSADFNQDGKFDLAAAGLRPPDIAGESGLVHVLVLIAGASKPLHAVLPIGDSGLCAAPIETRVEYPSGKRPRLAVDDGACDAFRFYVGGTPPELAFERN